MGHVSVRSGGRAAALVAAGSLFTIMHPVVAGGSTPPPSHRSGNYELYCSQCTAQKQVFIKSGTATPGMNGGYVETATGIAYGRAYRSDGSVYGNYDCDCAKNEYEHLEIDGSEGCSQSQIYSNDSAKVTCYDHNYYAK